MFKDAAFNMKEGEVSTALTVGADFHLIKLVKRVPPKAVKFDDVKDSLRTRLTALQLDDLTAQYVRRLGDAATQNIKFADPRLAAQFQARLKAAQEREGPTTRRLQ